MHISIISLIASGSFLSTPPRSTSNERKPQPQDYSLIVVQNLLNSVLYGVCWLRFIVTNLKILCLNSLRLITPKMQIASRILEN